MKTLEEEAKEYTNNEKWGTNQDYRAFIAGANSKYVQIEKIKAQIEILETIHTWSVSNRQDDATLYAVRMKITSLYQQLKKLEK